MSGFPGGAVIGDAKLTAPPMPRHGVVHTTQPSEADLLLNARAFRARAVEEYRRQAQLCEEHAVKYRGKAATREEQARRLHAAADELEDES